MKLPDQDTYVCHTQVAEYEWLAVVTGKARARDNNFHESSHCWNLRYSNSYSYKLDVFIMNTGLTFTATIRPNPVFSTERLISNKTL